MNARVSEVTGTSHSRQRNARENGAVFGLGAVVVFLAFADGANVQLSLGYGLSVKNAILYVAMLALAAKIVVQRDFQLELPGLHACFVVLIAYAILSYLTCAFALDVPRYRTVQSVIVLKGKIIDHFIFFLVFFYGLRDSANAHRVMRLLLVGAVFANALAVLDALGYIQLGELETRKDGRVGGVIGESNQYGAYVALLLPGVIAAAITSQGVRRWLWLIGSAISAIALVMTVSRGAYVGIIVATIWAAFLIPRYLPIGRIVSIGAVTLLFVFIAVAVLGASYGQLVAERLIDQSFNGDMVYVSSGRTEIWAIALARMAEAPLTFLTGYGWDVYVLMPFRYATHNHYLWFWFDLGLVGLICGFLQFALPVRYARMAMGNVAAPERAALIAFIVGTLAFGIAAFFVNLFSPFAWYWAYVGLALRIAVNGIQVRNASKAMPQAEGRRDTFGWAAARDGLRGRAVT